MSVNPQIKRQVEFYFSNSNLRNDKFLQSEMKKNEGWIDISVLLLFNKLKLLNATEDSIFSSLQDSEVVELRKDENDNKRYIKKIITEEYTNYMQDETVNDRIFYLKGFDSNSTMEEIYEYLQFVNFCEFVNLKMVYENKKEFTGAILVELKNSEDCEKVMQMKIPVYEKDEVVKKRKIAGQEGIENFIYIQKRNVYIEESKSKKKEKMFEIKKKAIIDDMINKFYKYEGAEDLKINDIKKIIEGVAYVDCKQHVLRFKENMDFNEKEFEKNGTTIKIFKLDEEESKKYAESIDFTNIDNPKKKKNRKR